MLRKMTTAAGCSWLTIIVFLASATFSAAQEHQYSAHAWSFGIMGDTQWTASDPAGANPHTVSVSIINQLNRQFIIRGVKFVIQMGDGEDWASADGTATSAGAARSLYDAGIGFFPMRGNHTMYFRGTAPADLLLPAFRASFPQTRGLQNTFGAENFSSPTGISADLNGLSYSFDYGPSGGNARFIIIDAMGTPSANRLDSNTYIYFGYPIGAQQSWIDSRLDKSTMHAFVLSHQPLISENHADSPFGGLVSDEKGAQNTFISGLQKNGVKYYISGHDHIDQRSIISSPDGWSKVEELIAAPACPKFYIPSSVTDPKWNGQKEREIPLSQEMNNVGFYIYTVDGPRVNVDYYSDQSGHYMSDNSWPKGPVNAGTRITPEFKFVKKENWGYSLNGREFLIAQGAPYTDVADRFGTTSFRILDGVNSSTAVDFNGRKFTREVNTGWTPKNSDKLKSDILSLWGMADLGSSGTDTYVLSLSFNPGKNLHIEDGTTGIATVDSEGNWVNAVSRNFGGTKKFVVGPHKHEYGLGTYGVDRDTMTAWAVINYSADFAVAEGIEPATSQGRKIRGIAHVRLSVPQITGNPLLQIGGWHPLPTVRERVPVSY
jgi:hypothetical protein